MNANPFCSTVIVFRNLTTAHSDPIAKGQKEAKLNMSVQMCLTLVDNGDTALIYGEPHEGTCKWEAFRETGWFPKANCLSPKKQSHK